MCPKANETTADNAYANRVHEMVLSVPGEANTMSKIAEGPLEALNVE